MSGRAVRDPSQERYGSVYPHLVINAQVALDSVSPEVLGDTKLAVTKSLEIASFEQLDKISAES